MKTKVYSSGDINKRCDNLLTTLRNQIVKELMLKHKVTFDEGYLLFIRTLDTQKIQKEIIEISFILKKDFVQTLSI